MISSSDGALDWYSALYPKSMVGNISYRHGVKLFTSHARTSSFSGAINSHCNQ